MFHKLPLQKLPYHPMVRYLSNSSIARIPHLFMFYFSSFITDFFTIYFIFLENRLHGSPTKKMPDAIPEEAESETGSHLNVQGVLAS